MRSLQFIISRSSAIAALAFALLVWATAASGQTIAIVTPETNRIAERAADGLSNELAKTSDVLDLSLSRSAFDALSITTPFNMTARQSSVAATAVGCDYLIIIRSATMRRTALERPEYYESFASVFVISQKLGNLIDWSNSAFNGASIKESEDTLIGSMPKLAANIRAAIAAAGLAPAKLASAEIEEMPADGTPGALNFRSPIPYLRIKPEYTAIASFYDVAATVEIELTLASDGSILAADVVRWAGFGLDGSALKAVRSMQWRPAERNGKTLPIRVLLRYNFKKLER